MTLNPVAVHGMNHDCGLLCWQKLEKTVSPWEESPEYTPLTVTGSNSLQTSGCKDFLSLRNFDIWNIAAFKDEFLTIPRRIWQSGLTRVHLQWLADQTDFRSLSYSVSYRGGWCSVSTRLSHWLSSIHQWLLRLLLMIITDRWKFWYKRIPKHVRKNQLRSSFLSLLSRLADSSLPLVGE